MFRMSAFFLIAGFFARMLVERRGVKAFVKDRAKRVAVPLFLFGLVVVLTIAVGFVLGALAHGVDFLMSLVQAPQTQPAQRRRRRRPRRLGGINLAHLWFLYYLLIFYALALAIALLVRAVDPRGVLAAVCDRVVAFVMRGVWGPVLIALPIAAYLWQLESWTEWLGLPAPFSFIPNMTALIGYGIAFGLGWLLNRQVQALLDLQKIWFVYFVLAVALTIFCLSTIGTTPRWAGAISPARTALLYTAAYVVGLWCWVFAFVGAAVRFLSNAEPRDALSRRRVVLGLPDAHGDDDLLHHAAAALRLALEHQVRDLRRRLDADPARDLSLSRALHVDRRDVERPPPSAAREIAAAGCRAGAHLTPATSRTLN